MKNSLRSRSIVIAATLACAVVTSACVMDASPTPSPTPTTAGTTTTTQIDLSGATIQSPRTNEPLAPKVNSAIGADNAVPVPPPEVLPKVTNGPEIEDPNGSVEDGPRPHPWEPAPDDPNKPKIGGAEQTSNTSSSPPSTGK